MQKPAESRYPLMEAIRQRWSPVAFDPRPIERDKLGSLLEAARWSPSSYNEQPWAYIIAGRENSQQFATLIGCLAPANAAWAKNAGVLLLAVASMRFAHNGKPNRHAFHDVGLANAGLVLQATSMGLATHQMAGFDVEKSRQELSIPEGWEPATMIAVGYAGDGSSLSADLARRDQAPRGRKPLADMVFDGTWGQPAAVAK